MIDTALALLFAHLLADYVFQTKRMVDDKQKIGVFARHIASVFVLTVLCLGTATLPVLILCAAVAAAHGVIDAIKTWALPKGWRDTLWAYLADQALHLATLAAALRILPDAFAQGWWPTPSDPARIAVLTLCGLIVTTLATAPVIAMFMKKVTQTAPEPQQQGEAPKDDAQNSPDTADDETERTGRIIGNLERSLIFLLVMIGQPAGVGFLIAAKSILRFEANRTERLQSEYVIIGTLASFALALALSLLTRQSLLWLGLETAPPAH